MRQECLPKIHSIRLLSDAAPMKLGEAKIEVHKSPTWADRRASDDAFHEAAFKVLEAEILPDERMNDVLRTGT